MVSMLSGLRFHHTSLHFLNILFRLRPQVSFRGLVSYLGGAWRILPYIKTDRGQAVRSLLTPRSEAVLKTEPRRRPASSIKETATHLLLHPFHAAHGVSGQKEPQGRSQRLRKGYGPWFTSTFGNHRKLLRTSGFPWGFFNRGR